MSLHERTVDRGGVSLHVVTWEPPAPSGTPLLFVPGLAETADEYAGFLRALGPRPAAAVTMRGRGRSTAPAAGYTAGDHAADLAAVADALGYERHVLFAFSRGTTYALAYVARRPDRIAGLVVGDYPAVQRALPPDFATWYARRWWRGRPTTDRTAVEVLEALQRDSAEHVDLWEVVGALERPVLLVHGGRDDDVVVVSDEDVERYRAAVTDLTVAVLPDTGHDLWAPDPAPLLAVLGPWLERVDTAS